MTLFVSSHSGKDDIPLVLLHGFGGSHRVWDKVRSRLDPSLPVLAFDLPGHGHSLDGEGRGGAGRMAKAIHQALEGRGLEAWHLAGHSLGGAVAALVALRAPERTRSLTLIAPGGMSPAIDAALLSRFAAAATRQELEDVVSALAAPDPYPDERELAALVAERGRQGARECLGETFGAMFPDGPDHGQGVISHGQLSALGIPVEVLWGSEDRVLPCPTADQLPGGFVLTVLAGRGHMLPETAATETAALIGGQAARA